MKYFAAILVLSLSAFAQDHPAAPTCVTTSFTGSVKRGLPFVQTIGSGLTYQIVPVQYQKSDPSKPPDFNGWTIRIAYLKNRGEMEREFSWVLTPPHDGRNARELATSTTDLSGDHTVYFPISLLNYAAAQTGHDLQKISVGSAKWTVVGVPGGFAGSVPGRPDLERVGISEINFKVELTVPKSLKLAPDLAIKAKPSPCPVADFRYAPADPRK